MALYDSIAGIYDPWSASVVEDVSFYVDEAKRSKGPVVELAVGTGRIAVPIACAGIRVIGVDLSGEMLGVARSLAAEHAVEELVDLRLGDLCEPPVSERVPLVICPFRSLLHMHDEGEKLRALRAARDLLEPEGRLVFDVFAPSPEDVAETNGIWIERERDIFERADWDEDNRRLRLSVRSGGSAASMDLHWLSAIEWRRLIDEAGFDVAGLYGWFDRTPFRGGEDMIWVCTARGPSRPSTAPAPGRCSVPSMIAVWIILALVVVLVIYLIALYNGLVQKRNRVDNAWAQIEVQLKRRRDLIPNLVETVKGYAAHERGTFEAVTEARARAAGAQGPAETAAAEGFLSQALGRLFAVAEAYPDLKANVNFLDLQAQLKDTEDKIAISRQVYNDTVLTFNNAIQVFPAVLLAGPLGFVKREFFEVEDAADREVPTVSFQPDAPAAAPAPAPSAGDAPTPPAQ